jgi:hypothetical protein
MSLKSAAVWVTPLLVVDLLQPFSKRVNLYEKGALSIQ